MIGDDMKTLKRYDVSEQTFDAIMDAFPDNIISVADINQYWCGYKNTDLAGQKKKIAYYTDNKDISYLVMLEYQLKWIVDDIDEDTNNWKQCIVRKVTNQTDAITSAVDGSHAWNYIRKLLKKYYTNDFELEFTMHLNAHQAEYDANNKQFHYLLPINDELLVFDNCYKYDINGAHHAALIELFPEAKDDLMQLYLNRHKNPLYKAYVNYFIGMLARKGFRKTYNWVVQRTNSILQAAMNISGGQLIYANTDGYIVVNPDKLLVTSTDLGNFKLEYQGEVRFYRDSNWYAYEIDSDNENKRITGNVRQSVRKLIDLKNRQIVHYTAVKKEINGGNYIYQPDNIETEII